MPVRQLRRLDVPVASLADELQSQALHCIYFRSDVARVQRQHAGLIIRQGQNILLAQAAGSEAKLAYAFESDRAFTELFPEMLNTLLPRARRALRVDGVRFRLSHSPSRPIVEPVLKRLAFTPKRDWLQFDINRGDALKPAAVAGLRLRAATEADAGDIARIDEEAFPDTPMPAEAVRSQLRDGEREWLLAVRGRTLVGYCSFASHDPEYGYIHDLAVAIERRNTGIGGALTARALKRLFSQGADSVGLTTDDTNSAAIRLYRSLGFRQTKAGRDYARPSDPQAVERMHHRAQGTLIKFGGWR